MIIAAEFPFNGGDMIKKTHSKQFQQVEHIINSIDASSYKTKKSKEKTKQGKMLYHPPSLNKAFSKDFVSNGWQKNKRVKCLYSTKYYRQGYKPKGRMSKNPYREMDFVKDRVGIEVQFGKYSFMVYNVCAKMTIFHNLGYIDVGIEVVPVKSFAKEMSSGVSYFEQFVWDLEHRGVADIDIPVLILGIDV